MPGAAAFSKTPGVAGEVMPAPARAVAEDMHVAEPVPPTAPAGLRQGPVVDAERRLVGMVARSGLVAALHRGRLAEAEALAA